MGALALLAVSFIPDLIHLIAGDKTGTLAGTIAKTVQDVTGTTAPADALQLLQADAAKAADLRARLAQIALDAQKAQNDEADKVRADQLSTLQAQLSDTANARGTMAELAAAHSDIAWVPLIVSAVVTVGFIAIVIIVILFGNRIGNFAGQGNAGNAGPALQVINICIGTLATGFATVINFWLGSSQGSRDKDAAALTMQAASNTQFNNALATVSDVTKKAVDAAARPATPAAPAKPDNFDKCVGRTLLFEGGFTEDAGGPTNFGITQRTLEAFLGHSVTEDDVRSLTGATAIEIYRANYWNQMRCADLPAGVDLMVFDFGVNSGCVPAVKALQHIVGVPEDGAIGKVTLPVVQKFSAVRLINDLFDARMAFLRGRDDFATDGDGWTRRVTDMKQVALQMQDVACRAEA